MDKSDIAISVIEKELESNASVHIQVIADMALDDDYGSVCWRLRLAAPLAVERFNELYAKHLRKYAIEEYSTRVSESVQGDIDKMIMDSMGRGK